MALAAKTAGGLATTGGGGGICTIFPGDCVEIFGLSGAKELNGCNGVVTKKIIDTGRFEVRVGVDKRVTIKPENLRICHNGGTQKVGDLGFGEADRKAEAEAALTYRPDDIVEVGYLEGFNGREYNGKCGTVVFDDETPPGRVKVRFEIGGPGNRHVHKTLKPANLKKLSMASLTGEQRAQLGLKDDGQKDREPPDDNFTRIDMAVDLSNVQEGSGPVKPGDVVEVSGLGSDAGKKLNGDKGVVLQCFDEDGRAEVRLDAGTKKLKFENLVKMDLAGGDRFMVEVFGLQSESGKAMNGQRGFARAKNEETGRYEVKLSKDKIASLKPENLRLLNMPK